MKLAINISFFILFGLYSCTTRNYDVVVAKTTDEEEILEYKPRIGWKGTGVFETKYYLQLRHNFILQSVEKQKYDGTFVGDTVWNTR